MAFTGVYVEGLRDMTRSFEKAGVDVEELKDVMGDVAAEHATVLARLVPVGSPFVKGRRWSLAGGSRNPGALRASVRGNRAKGRALVTIGKARTKYAAAINYGWKRRGIRPVDYVGKADDVMGTRAVEMITDGWNKIAERNGLT